jgi:hypothetical protein
MLFQRCLPVLVPTDNYRLAERSSGWSTKRLARTSSGGGETVTLANGDGTGGIDGQFKEVKPRTGVRNKAAWGANGEPDACNKKKGERGGAKMKVVAMTDTKVKERIDGIQRAGIAVTGDGLRRAIAQSIGDEAKGEADND